MPGFNPMIRPRRAWREPATSAGSGMAGDRRKCLAFERALHRGRHRHGESRLEPRQTGPPASRLPIVALCRKSRKGPSAGQTVGRPPRPEAAWLSILSNVHRMLDSTSAAPAAMEAPAGLEPSNGDSAEKLIRLYRSSPQRRPPRRSLRRRASHSPW